MQREIIGNCELLLGDCRDILPNIKRADAVVTDPPYGVLLGEKDTGQKKIKRKSSYEGFSDTREYLTECVIPAIKTSLSITKRALITPGNKNVCLYPPYDDIGVWFNPAGIGIGKWGFILAHIILYYGKNPRKLGNGASSIIGNNTGVGELLNIHPCPKPLYFMKWAVDKVSFENQLILDPFMGNGTTGVACVELNRKFIGIEINENYFNSVCKRIETAAAQGTFEFNKIKETPDLGLI
jgi:DNA modification methylase